VIFAELDWVPGNLTQAEDRCHRIGAVNPVLVQHLVLDGSLDARMAHILVEKQAVIDAALDATVDLGAKIPALPVTRDVSTADARPEGLAKEAESLSAEAREAIHAGLRALAGVCDGAYMLDGHGFNKFDAKLGHELAGRTVLTPKQAALGQRLVRKYQRQLPDALLRAAGIEPKTAKGGRA
jgi:hypothetical protein